MFSSGAAHRSPRSGDARRHRPGGSPSLRGPQPRSSTPTAAASPTPTSTPAPTRWRPVCWPTGIGPGDVVLLRLPSDTAYVVAYAAAAKVGRHHRRGQPPAGRARAGRGRRPWPAARSPSPTRTQVEDLRPSGCRRRRWPTTPTGPSPSCSPRARPASPRARCSASRQLAAVTRIDVRRRVGRPGRAADADAGQHAVRPRRVHDQAAVVPAPRHHHPHPRTLAGGRRAGVRRRAPHPHDRRRRPAGGAAAARGPRGLRPRAASRP